MTDVHFKDLSLTTSLLDGSLCLGKILSVTAVTLSAIRLKPNEKFMKVSM